MRANLFRHLEESARSGHHSGTQCGQFYLKGRRGKAEDFMAEHVELLGSVLQFDHFGLRLQTLPSLFAARAAPRQKLCVWDPFCGKGTLLLEALGIAMGVPPASPAAWR